MTTQRRLFACWITKATDTHSKYVILIAFSQQTWLRERVSLLSLRALPVVLFSVVEIRLMF